MTAAGVLVVGYGNPLRGDDGAGWHAATRLAADPRLAGAAFAHGDRLSPALQRVLPEVVDKVARVVEEHADG